jgi:hypothetical protein
VGQWFLTYLLVGAAGPWRKLVVQSFWMLGITDPTTEWYIPESLQSLVYDWISQFKQAGNHQGDETATHMHTAPKSLLLIAVFKLLYRQPWSKKRVVYPFIIMCTQNSNETQLWIYSSPKLIKLIVLTNLWRKISLLRTFPVQVFFLHMAMEITTAKSDNYSNHKF